MVVIKMKYVVSIVKSIMDNIPLTMNLAKNDFKSKYASSLFGIIWAYAQPLMTIFVFWFVFQMGFKSAPVHDIPFILWFVPAYVPWIYFSDILNSSASCMLEYNYLVKKVQFNVEVLPTVKIISAGFVHIFFIGFIVVMYAIYRIPLSISCIQVFYYTAALTLLGFGLAMLVSSITVIFKDLVPVISIILQVGFWIIPICWNPETMEPWVINVLKINPIYYIVSGYRDAFIYHIPFWEHPVYTGYFWSVTLVVFVLGCSVFAKLRPHFADEL